MMNICEHTMSINHALDIANSSIKLIPLKYVYGFYMLFIYKYIWTYRFMGLYNYIYRELIPLKYIYKI